VRVRGGCHAQTAERALRLSRLSLSQVFGPGASQKDLYDEAIVPIVVEARPGPAAAPRLSLTRRLAGA